jgi:hypothetical protein
MKFLILFGLFISTTAFGQASGYVATCGGNALGTTGFNNCTSRSQVNFNIQGTSTYTPTQVTTTAPLVISADLADSEKTTAEVGVVAPSYSFAANTFPVIESPEQTVIATSYNSSTVTATSATIAPIRMEDVDLAVSASGFSGDGSFNQTFNGNFQ